MSPLLNPFNRDSRSRLRQQRAPPSVLIHLPRGPFLPNPDHESSLLSTLKAGLPFSTVVQLNYRLGGEHLYPQHIHDTLAGYDWIKTHLLPKRGILRAGRAEHIGRIAVSGELIGGGLAAMLAVTECRIGEAGVVAAALNNPIVDWVGIDDEKESHPASEEMEDLLSTARSKLFKRPGHYFDSFASPVLFFRSPGKEVPKFSGSGPLNDLEHLAYLEREDFFRQQLALSAIPNRLKDVETQEEEGDSNPGKTKSPRKTSKRYPSPSLGLKLPPFHISSGSLSPLSEQADEMAQLLRKSFLRTAQTSDFGRKVLLPEEIAKLSDEERLERQALVAEAYEMVESVQSGEKGVWGCDGDGEDGLKGAVAWLRERLG
ncbi:hypothetical protein D0864_01667 [Hortaea werneckii]|uniref:Alpha/beta hydrolase fold-3 domain-containing protein n=1 Tax=Hortaea werneckii TaxID=91943 RepID=A0A3M7H660_HORWE|nr:hypothetical protein D0864_01667 [Hortaea werneckii]